MLRLSDDELARRFGRDTLVRGRAYEQEGRVQQVQEHPGSALAAVRGSGRRTYQTLVVAHDAGGALRLTTSCTCPVGGGCKHAVALLLRLRRQLGRAAVAPWRRALEPLTHAVASLADEPLVPLALQFDDRGYGLTVRPLKMGRSGRWIKTGATWDDLRSGLGDVDPAHREALLAMTDARRRGAYDYGYRVDGLPLGDLRADAWRLLRAARDAGVTFVAGEGARGRALPQPVLSDETVVPTLAIERTAAGVALSPRLVGPAAPDATVVFIGAPPHGCAVLTSDRLLLAPLSRPLQDAEHALFRSGRTIEVPDADLPAFATGYLPRLRQRLAVRVGDGVELPEASPPQLVCRVAFAARDGRVAHRASVTWGFRYRVGAAVHDLPLRPGRDEPPVRDAEAEAALAASVPAGPWLATGRRGQALLQDAIVGGRLLFTLVGEVLPALRARPDVVVEVAGEQPEFHESDAAPAVRLAVTDGADGDWFNLDVEVTLGAEVVPFAELFAALARGDDHLLLDSGTWFALDHPELDRLRHLIEEARLLADREGGSLRLRPEHAGLWEELVALGVVAEQSAAWRDAVSALLDLDALPETPPPPGLDADLRPYQLTGFRWLSFLWRSRLGGILADEMGLGKTLQALALVEAARAAGELDAPVLVVAPTSVLGTWAAEAARFAPQLDCVTITETEARRGVPLAEAVRHAHLVFTSYTLLRLEADAYRALPWAAVLLDEAQFVKNRASKAYQAVRKLRARVKIALTGTPLENNLMDLWSLLSITAPGLFADPTAFTDLYRKPIEAGDADALARLHRRIRPLVLRRTKAAVAAELPEKQEQVVPVELGAGQRRLYDKHLARERAKVLGLIDDLDGNRIAILRSLTLLRQLSLSPVLVDATYAAQSAKIDALVELLGEVVSEGHRALVFSQFTGFLALVRARLDAEGVTYQYLDGRTRDRAARIAAFRGGDDPVFLISLKAGGFGLTLTEADYVFILDPWWNPAAELQAIDRTHRIGQDKPVNVYRLVAADTIEEKVVALQRRKRDLFDAVVGRASDVAAPLSADDIRGLLEA
nr:DEAD/DEAH box helicase [Propionibacterium sp.]